MLRAIGSRPGGKERREDGGGGGGGIVKEKGEYILYIQKMRKFKN